MAGFFRKVKERAQAVANRIQKILVFILLLFTYFVLFGLSLPLVALFQWKLLWPQRKNADTFWIEAEGYSPDLEDCSRQS